ncbi:hypothetical protein [Halalkaliarchaeum desulfuricum]|uniref:hypothetical protein n=1 Tax=Halalkaliarchaeum desulfuricum TaxID=2055893 RepID=UPI000E6C28D8|nr:hypothetical protein [Halalkaliarchaeum desulfuricum]
MSVPEAPRRAVLGSLMTVALGPLAGCSEVREWTSEPSDGDGDSTEKHPTLEDVTVDEIEVSVEAVLRTEEVQLLPDGDTTDAIDLLAPENSVYKLFLIQSYNPTAAPREAPRVTPMNYDSMGAGPRENDIRVYGSGDGGYFPEINREIAAYDLRLEPGGNILEGYPAGERPVLEPNSSVRGWVIGVIEENPPYLQIQFNGESATWTTDPEIHNR